MREQNDGIGEDNVLQNRFTAYLMAAIRNRKINYLQNKARLQRIEIALEAQFPLISISWGEDLSAGLSVIDQLESHWLQDALRQARERELYILFARALYGQSFADIAQELGLKLKTVTSIYYRLIERLREDLRGDAE